MIAPADEAGIIAVVQAARAAREPLAIEGQGSKRGLLRPVQAARSLSTRGLTGVTLYRPAELIISARAGTPLAEIEAVLAEKGQQLIAESPYLNGVFGTSAAPSIGGVVAANLSGPRRITWGATRDHVMGLRFINGAGEVIRSGGRVLKNVTGLDLCKLLSGSYGTLGVITEVTLKVLPGLDYMPGAPAADTLMLSDLLRDQWRFNTFGADANNPLIAGDTADPDRDGLPNLLEYALGRLPLTAEAPALRVVHDFSGVQQRLTLTRDPAATDVLIQVKRSATLQSGSWNTSALQIDQNTPTMLQVRDTTARTPGTRSYLRVEASPAP